MTRRKKRTQKRSAAAVRPSAAISTGNVGPTPQTAAKLRRDLIDHFLSKGRLRPEHAAAAEDIRRIWQAFSRCLGPTAVNPAALATGRRSGQLRQPIEWLTAAEETIWRDRYRPWAREMSACPCGGTIRVTRFQVAIEIVVDNRGVRQLEGFYRMRHGAAVDHLRRALQRYAEIAGWIDEIG